MTNLERLLKYKKISFKKDGEGQISVKFFKHSFLLVENSENEYWITIIWDKESKLSKEQTKKAFIKFVQLLKSYKIEYVFDELLHFN